MSNSSNPFRRLQFRIATLLLLTAYVALICLGFRSPTPLWAGIISILTLVSVLSAMLVAVYCPGPSRAMAVGYLLFCVGYLVHLTLITDLLSHRLYMGTTSLWAPLSWLFEKIHSASAPASPANPHPRGNFLSIGHHALASLLGLLGSLLAQYLYATKPLDKPSPNNC